MTENQTPPLRRRRRRRRAHRKTPWNRNEWILFSVSLAVFLSMTLSGLSPLVYAVRQAQRDAAAAVANQQRYITFFRDVITHMTPDEQTQDIGFQVDISQFAGDTSEAGQLYAMREQYPDEITEILTYYENSVCTVNGEETTVGELMLDSAISQRLLLMAVSNSETIPFVAGYPRKHQNSGASSPMKTTSTSKVPLYIQWDDYWGYDSYGDGLLGYTGCAPTCLAMAVSCLTGKGIMPTEVAHYADEQGYYSTGSGSSWTLVSEGSSHFGLTAEAMTVNEGEMEAALSEGKLIICTMSPGDFTQTGHFILLTGYQDGSFTVNDPNSIIRSGQSWSYERIHSQIKNLWALSAQQ